MHTSRLLALTLAVTGCAQMFPAKVADGVARLTVRDAGAVLLAANADITCGFASELVDASPTFNGEVGHIGTATWTIDNCAIDLGVGTVLSTDCQDVSTSAAGKVTVSARKVVRGWITGDPDTPIIPQDADSVEFFIDMAEFEDFDVRKTGSDSHMRILSGSMSGKISPRLARDVTNNACSVITPHITFEGLTWGPSQVSVTSGGRTFEVPIQEGTISAQNGTKDANENAVTGQLSLWNTVETVALSGAEDGLDPEYDVDAFESSYTCNEELVLPVDYSCPLAPALGDGASKLMVRNFATLTKAISADEICGFESPEVLAGFTTEGDVGYDGGSATYHVTDCALDFPEPVEVSTDCNGVTTWISGTAIVSGTKTVHGFVTGSATTPVIPNSDAPASVVIDADVSGLTVRTSASDAWMVMDSGRLSGALTPKTLQDMTSGACAISSPNALMENITFDGGEVSLFTEGRTFRFDLDEVDLLAVNGQYEGMENFLEGALTVDGEDIAVPLEGAEPLLDPEYDPVTFVDSYACEADALVPTMPADCDFEATLAESTARLVVKNFGLVTKTVDLDSDCGFENTWSQVSEFASFDILDAWWNEEVETVVLPVDRCTIESRPVATDCSGNHYSIEGSVEVTGTKSITGLVTIDDPPLHPQDRRSASFNLPRIAIQGFTGLELAVGNDAYEPHLTMHEGMMSGRYLPVTGEAADTHGAYFIKLPIGEFQDIRLRQSPVTLYSGDMMFHLMVNDSSLQAFNGAYRDQANSLHGQITVNGRTWMLGSSDVPLSLDPDYDQSVFDAAYVCLDNLRELVEVD